MAPIILFYRLSVRPLLREPLRAFLTALAVALGVAAVLAIEFAGSAAAGSFRSSVETLAGNSDFSVTAIGGVPGELAGVLARLPLPLTVQPRLEDFATDLSTGRTLSLFGIDMISASSEDTSLVHSAANPPASASARASPVVPITSGSGNSINLEGVWLSADLGRRAGDRIQLQINDHAKDYTVLGVIQVTVDGGSMVIMDLSVADLELDRHGKLDEILLKVPGDDPPDVWTSRLRPFLPAGVEISPAGSRTDENRKMLAAFRWNLRVLSYIALVVGAFLIYNTVSVSVARRRPDIGIFRALGGSRAAVVTAFLGEAVVFGMTGSVMGWLLGRVMATGAVRLLAATVNSLYVSSRPAPIESTFSSALIALLIGVGISIAAAWGPAREASDVPPTEAMARGRKEYVTRVHKRRDFWISVGLAVFGFAASFAPPFGGKPIFGYLGAVLFIGASALAMPAFVDTLTLVNTHLLRSLLGVEGTLAVSVLRSSLRRTSVLVAALSTAIAMIASVGIMVGSFRQTVALWMESQLQADFYIRPTGSGGADQHPTIAADLTDRLRTLPGIAAIDRFRAYDITYDGLPATLGSADLQAAQKFRRSEYLSGRPSMEVYDQLMNTESVVISEPFANKHKLKGGDTIMLPLGNARVSFRIADVYYDYGSEAGYIIVDRARLLKYLPDPAPSNVAVYVAPGADFAVVRRELEQQTEGRRLLIVSNSAVRKDALQIFDRTFAITYALEAVSIMVAVIGIAGALLALVIDRRREFGLLRFLGASAGQIRKLIVVEAGLIGLLANIAGLILGSALSLVLIFVINKQSFGWTIQVHLPVGILLGSLALVYACTLLAALYPARVAVRLNPIEVVHEE